MSEVNTTKLIETLFEISRFMKQEMSYNGNYTHLSILQIQTLVFLNQNKNVSMSDIAGHFHIESPSATSLLNKLNDLKVVKRDEDKKDRRLVIIALTNEGKMLLKQAMQQRKIKIERILEFLSEKEKIDLLSILETISTKLLK